MNYLLTLPGTLVYKWNGQTFAPAYIRDENNRLQFIRPNLPVLYAQRLIQAGKPPNTGLFEIYRPNPPVIGQNLSLPYPEITWDGENLNIYANLTAGYAQAFALDGDLAGDFSDTRANGDGLVFEVSLASCDSVPKVRPAPGGRDVSAIVVSAGKLASGGYCWIEATVPLRLLGVERIAPPQQKGWMETGEGGRREYHPVMVKTMGFAFWNRGFPGATLQNLSDPTTWSTLVLMQDR